MKDNTWIWLLGGGVLLYLAYTNNWFGLGTPAAAAAPATPALPAPVTTAPAPVTTAVPGPSAPAGLSPVMAFPQSLDASVPWGVPQGTVPAEGQDMTGVPPWEWRRQAMTLPSQPVQMTTQPLPVGVPRSQISPMRLRAM